MNEREKKAFDFAADLTKQLITLSTGIVTITLLLSKDLVGPRVFALLAWTFYLLSTVFGLWALMALTGTLAPLKRKMKPHAAVKPASSAATDTEVPFEIGGNVRTPSALQIFAFGLATLFTLVYVIATFARPQKIVTTTESNCCCQCSPSSLTH
jgi:hypothetical protein